LAGDTKQVNRNPLAGYTPGCLRER